MTRMRSPSQQSSVDPSATKTRLLIALLCGGLATAVNMAIMATWATQSNNPDISIFDTYLLDCSRLFCSEGFYRTGNFVALATGIH